MKIITGIQRVKDTEDKNSYLFFAKDSHSGTPPFFKRIFYDTHDEKGNILAFAKDRAKDFECEFLQNPGHFC